MAEDTVVTRRNFLRTASGTTAAVALSTLLPAPARAQGRSIKIGYVSPQTGPLAGFGEADTFVVGGVRKALGKGLMIRDRSHPVEILVRDSQSDPNPAAEVASRLILSDKVDLMLVASTPETTNPVSDQCEVNGTPAISSVCPWQPWFFARGGKPEVGFKSTYHFFWGLEDIIGVFIDMWNSVETNKVVGALWPNDGDGNAWGDKERGFPPALAKAGYKVIDPGRYPNLSDDFSAQIATFKREKVEIVTGVPIPPDWTTFWKQAAQQGFRPRLASIGKALLFPRSVEALGDLGDGMSTEVWWTPQHPFKSSLTGATAAAFAAEYTREAKKQWTQPLGFIHALFEVGLDALKRAQSLDDKGAIAAAIKATNLNTLVGPISWAKGPVPNVTKTPLVGGQWGRLKTKDPRRGAAAGGGGAPAAGREGAGAPAGRRGEDEGAEREQARASTTDPEARVMKMADGGFRPAFNGQFATDTAAQVIEGVDASNAGSDLGQLAPMVAQVQARYGPAPEDVLADGDYVKLEDIVAVAQPGVGCTVYAPVPQPRDPARDPFQPLPGDPEAIAQWRARMGTEATKVIYKERAATSECVNALARNRGLRHFLVRGLAKAKAILLTPRGVRDMTTFSERARNFNQAATSMALGTYVPLSDEIQSARCRTGENSSAGIQMTTPPSVRSWSRPLPRRRPSFAKVDTTGRFSGSRCFAKRVSNSPTVV